MHIKTNTKLGCFKLFFSLLLSWVFLVGIIIFVIKSSDSNYEWKPSDGGAKWEWLKSVVGMDQDNFESAQYEIPSNSSESAKIVIWTGLPLPFRHLKKRFDQLVTSMKTNLCFEECQLSFSRNQSVEGADAVIFLAFAQGFKREDLPVRTNFGQIWIYSQHEPPTKYTPGDDLNGQFNWTMTYRHDSDIHQPYYRTFPLDKPLTPNDTLHFGKIPISEWINGKSKLAMADISDCVAPSKRLPILKELQWSGIPIDIYGKCGDQSIVEWKLWKKWGLPGDNGDDDISSKYLFYFAFENSLCLDYVTEDFWRALEQGMVPIVMGGANYLGIAPPNSFIDLRDFPNPSDLKDYLEYLVKEPKAYGKFFEWRRQYRVDSNIGNFCELCSKLRQYKKRSHQDPAIYGDNPFQFKVHGNLSGWWGTVPGLPGQAVCITPEEFGFQNYLH